MQAIFRVRTLWLILAWALLTPSGASADWPNFRGPRYDGISDETAFRKEWTEPIPLVWQRNIGSAFSSFACVGDRVYTCGTANGQQVLFCLHADTGEVLWQRPFEEQYAEPQGGDGTRATPTVDEGRVYVLGAKGLLLCADAATGSELWRTQFGHMPSWGYSGSVLIEGDLAIVSAGESDGDLIAFDKKTGRRVWKCGGDPVGYATPYPFSFEGTRYVVAFTGQSFVIAEARTGRLVLRKPWETAWDVNAASPIFQDGHLWIGAGYDTGCALFKLRRDKQALAAEQVWKSKVLLNKFQSCVLHEGKLYASDQKALVCVDFLTGQEHWRKHRLRHGGLVLADGHLLLLTEKGELQIAKADPTGYEPKTTASILSGRCWTAPVLHKGKLYVRNLERIACFDLKP